MNNKKNHNIKMVYAVQPVVCPLELAVWYNDFLSNVMQGQESFIGSSTLYFEKFAKADIFGLVVNLSILSSSDSVGVLEERRQRKAFDKLLANFIKKTSKNEFKIIIQTVKVQKTQPKPVSQSIKSLHSLLFMHKYYHALNELLQKNILSDDLLYFVTEFSSDDTEVQYFKLKKDLFLDGLTMHSGAISPLIGAMNAKKWDIAETLIQDERVELPSALLESTWAHMNRMNLPIEKRVGKNPHHTRVIQAFYHLKNVETKVQSTNIALNNNLSNLVLSLGGDSVFHDQKKKELTKNNKLGEDVDKLKKQEEQNLKKMDEFTAEFKRLEQQFSEMSKQIDKKIEESQQKNKNSKNNKSQKNRKNINLNVKKVNEKRVEIEDVFIFVGKTIQQPITSPEARINFLVFQNEDISKKIGTLCSLANIENILLPEKKVNKKHKKKETKKEEAIMISAEGSVPAGKNTFLQEQKKEEYLDKPSVSDSKPSVSAISSTQIKKTTFFENVKQGEIRKRIEVNWPAKIEDAQKNVAIIDGKELKTVGIALLN
ncbi:MAG: hypothetical protein HKM04_07295 [Legionellales bacterium]|nr:hypothetical protein [Legionellales bacterium]